MAKTCGLGAQQDLLLPSSQLQTPTVQLPSSSPLTAGRFPGSSKTPQRCPYHHAWDSFPRQEPGLSKEHPASTLPLLPSPSSRPVVPVACTAWRAVFPRDGAQRGVLLGFSTRHLCCLVCIRPPEPRLLGQPRAVRLDKNNCEEGQEEGLSEAAWPCKVTQWVEGLRACSPRIPCSCLCSEAISLPSSNPGHCSSNRGNR